MARTGVPKAAAGGRAVGDAVGLSEWRWPAEPRQHGV